jgi:hypothetical protein
MPEINPSNPIKPSTTQPYAYLQGEEPPSKESTVKPSSDTLSSTSYAGPLPTSASSAAPKLVDPSSKKISISDYLLALSDALSGIKQQITASKEVDLDVRRNVSIELAMQSKEMGELITERSKAAEDMRNRIDSDLGKMNDHTNKMDRQTKNQQKAIDDLNKGNALEQKKNKELTDAYDKYIKDLESMGAVDKGNGFYEVPPESMDQYNASTKEYQKTVDDYNQYWSGRQKEIEKYNSGTVDYNKGAKENNGICDDFTDEYELSLEPPLGSQPAAAIRDISGTPKELKKPATITETPAVVQTFPPPKQTYDTAKSGVQPVPSISYTPVDLDVLREGMYQSQYDKFIAPFDNTIYSNVKFWSFTQNLDQPDADQIDESVKTTRMLLKKLQSKQIAEMIEKTSRNPLRSVSIDTPAVEKILAKSIIHQAILQTGIKLTEQQKAEITDQLIVVSLGLLSNSSLNSLFPSLSVIASSLSSLPQDNPVLPLLFSVSLMNRVIETAQLGLTKDTLTVLIEEHPELANLTEDQVNQIAASMNIGLLLTAGKLLETQLGLRGLMPHLLLPILESQTNIDVKQLYNEALNENKQALVVIQKELAAHYSERGYPEESAQFLADIGVRVVNEEHPQTTAFLPSSQNIDVPLLIDSLKANLLLVNGPIYSLADADSTAKEAVEHTLSEGPFKTTSQLYHSLEKGLSDIGIKGQSAKAARSVIIAPSLTPATGVKPPLSKDRPVAAPPPKLTENREAKLTPSPQEPIAAEFQPLPREQYALQLTKHVEQLAAPFLGATKARQIAEEVVQSLIGDLTTASQPSEINHDELSFVKALESQISTLREKSEQHYSKVIEEDFKETIKTSISFYAFSLKLMDPLAAYTMIGVMYSNRQSKGGNLII